MKTDDLIATLALDLPRTPRGQETLRLGLWLVPALMLALLALVLGLGLRSDLAQAVTTSTFMAKLAYAVGLGASGFWLLERAGRPGASVRAPLLVLFALLALAAVTAVMEMVQASGPDARIAALMGRSAAVCSTNIAVLSLATLPFIGLAARRLAPTRPALAGAAAGLLASGVAAALYGLHCPEHSATFVAVWYTGGMALVSGVGAVLGRWFLRW